jgi:hypothetical protein
MNTTRREVMKGIGALATLAVAPSESLLAQCVDPGTTNTGSTWWGSGHIMTSLGNTTLISGRIVTQAFRAKKTGSIRSVIWYNIHSTSAPGYSAGTGGNIRVRIEGSDASGHADGTPLGGSDTLTNAATAPTFPKQVLSSPAPVEAGKIYHVTFYNTHSDPNSNFVSTDCINIKSTLNVSPHNPQIPDIEDSVYYKNSGGSWIKRSQTPILDLEYTDGFHQGTPYMESWLNGNSSHWNAQITPTQWSRQNFTAPSTMTVKALCIAAKYVSGSGNLIMEIRDANGGVLRQVSWTNSEVLSTYQGWAPSKSITPLTLNGGSSYSFVLKGTGGVFTSYPLANGSVHYGFSPTIAVNGFCEYSTNSGGSWSGGWTAWNKTQRKDGTLIFCFGLA